VCGCVCGISCICITLHIICAKKHHTFKCTKKYFDDYIVITYICICLYVLMDIVCNAPLCYIWCFMKHNVNMYKGFACLNINMHVIYTLSKYIYVAEKSLFDCCHSLCRVFYSVLVSRAVGYFCRINFILLFSFTKCLWWGYVSYILFNSCNISIILPLKQNFLPHFVWNGAHFHICLENYLSVLWESDCLLTHCVSFSVFFFCFGLFFVSFWTRCFGALFWIM